MTPDDADGWRIPPRFWRWAASRTARVVLCWLVALGVGGQRLWHARQSFADGATEPPERRRPGGHSGHAQIDFGGQWVMGRMLVKGYGRELYHRGRQWEVVRAGFPPSAEPEVIRDESIVPTSARHYPARPGEDLRHDADWMMYWFMGEDVREWRTVGGAVAAALTPFAYPPAAVATTAAAGERVTPVVAEAVAAPAVGGPLYPPVQAFVMAPLALRDDPRGAYFLYQVVLLALAYAAALGVSVLSGGRVWWSVASAAVLLYPGCRACLDLGQNSTLSLTILVWGWVLAARGRNVAGGMVWGLLAFKPTWAAAFLLVPLVGRRWRFLLAMAVTGAGICAATLPVVGVGAWRDWLEVGRLASAEYDVSQNWNFLSRDLQGIPRRLLIDFTLPYDQRANPTVRLVGWGMWAVVVGTTVVVAATRADRRRAVGVGAAFLLLGAYLSCYRFMYYDSLLSVVGVAALCADPNRFRRATSFTVHPAGPLPSPFGPRSVGYVSSLPLTLVVGLGVYENVFAGAGLEATFGAVVLARPTVGPDGATGLATPRVAFDTTFNFPWDTYLLLALWAWCGLRLLAGEEKGS